MIRILISKAHLMEILNDRVSDLTLNKPENWQTRIDEIEILKHIINDRIYISETSHSP